MNYRIPTSIALAGVLATAPLVADEKEEVTPEDIVQALAKHQAGSGELADDQDELSADVQELIEEQTSDKVIELLGEVEDIMGEVIDNLDEHDTGGGTIAAETEVIEKPGKRRFPHPLCQPDTGR